MMERGTFPIKTAAFLPKEGKLGSVTASIETDVYMRDQMLHRLWFWPQSFMNLTFDQ